MNEALHLEYTVHAMAIVCAKLSSANLEEPHWTNIILDISPRARLQELEKTEVRRENNH